MTCPQCGRKMVKKTEYVWDAGNQRMIARHFWVCPRCDTRIYED